MKYPEDFIDRIICGDCLDIMKDIPSNSIDMILTDLPYFDVDIKNWNQQWGNSDEYLFWCYSLFAEYDRILKSNTNLFIFTGRQYNKRISLLLDQLFIERRIIIWQRKRMYNTTRGKSLASEYEPICYYSKGNKAIFNNIKLHPKAHLKNRSEYKEGGRLSNGINLSDVWSDIPALPHNSPEKTNHPSQKPLKLLLRCLLIGSKLNDLILDTCIGSGTTAEACINTGRHFIGIDNNEKYCQIAMDRITNDKRNYHL